MLTSYRQVLNESSFLNGWNGKKERYQGIKMDTTNATIRKRDLDKAINTSLVKQVYQYDNNTFHKIMDNGGFHIQHRLTEILFYKEDDNYYISSMNKKTEEMTIYPLDNDIDSETDKSIEIPLRNLQELIFDAVVYR